MSFIDVLAVGADAEGDALAVDAAGDELATSETLDVPIPVLVADLITSEHRDKPRFMASVAVSVQPLVDTVVVLRSMPGLFDLDVAVGDQLDKTGEWIGRSRKIGVPIVNVYFSFDISGVGFDQGVWQGPFDPSTGIESLPDDIYRILLRAQVVANGWDGSVEEAYDALEPLLTPSGVTIADNGNMTITVALTGTPPPPIVKALLTEQLVGFRPAAVQQIGP
jgi:hypothetical protein